MKNLRARGNALGGTLIVTLLLFLFGLTLANLATFNLRVVDKAGQRQEALLAAESGINRMASELSKEPRLGTDPRLSSDSNFDRRTVFSEEAQDGSRWEVSFSRDSEYRSVNNLVNLASTSAGRGRTVPPGHALLVAKGWARGQDEPVVIEALMRLEALQYAVAASGGVDLRRVDVRSPRNDAVTGERTGNIYGGGEAVTLTGPATVEGGVTYLGRLSTSGMTIAGPNKRETSEQSLPDFDIEEFNTINISDVQVLTARQAESMTSFSGTYYIEGNVNLGSRRPDGTPRPGLTESQFTTGIVGLLQSVLNLVGDLLDAVVGLLLGFDDMGDLRTLIQRFEPVVVNNATFYVNGNLTARRLTGTSTFFVNGVTAFADTNLARDTSNDRLTLFSERGILLLEGSKIGGVVLTHGPIGLEGGAEVRGALFANNQDSDEGGGITTIYNPGLVGGLLGGLVGGGPTPSLIERFEEQTANAGYWLALGGSGSKPVFTYWSQIH